MCSFLLGEGRSPEIPSHAGDHKLRQTLIERCDHLSDEVSLNRTFCFRQRNVVSLETEVNIILK